MRRYKFIVCGRNHGAWIERCLTSIYDQDRKNYDVWVVDDASNDSAPATVEAFCKETNWGYTLNEQPLGAMCNQVSGILAMRPALEDVIIWVDGDDALAHSHVLEVLDRHYDAGNLVTYGSYLSEPHSVTCVPARRYPDEVIRDLSYRTYKHLEFNHLRTVSYSIFQQLGWSDFKNPQGEWLQSCADAAVMIPSLELARGKTAFIEEVLYLYNSENPASDWRKHPTQVNRDHDHILDPSRKKV